MSVTQADIGSIISDETLPADASPVIEVGGEPERTPSRQGRPAYPPEVTRILRMRVPIIVKLAERDLPVASVLQLNIGSILEFERRADAELDMMVNNRTIGRGLAVKVGENFGLRLTSVGRLEQTIEALGPG